MTDQPKLTWKGRLIALGISAVLCIAAIEGVSRYLEGSHPAGLARLPMDPQPYFMYAGSARSDFVWRDILTNKDVPSQIRTNNLGFIVDGDFGVAPNPAFTRKYAKGPQDKIVLLSGASVAFGLGSTANDKTLAGQLETLLNAKQSKYRYRVVNLAMGSWIAYQQFIALSLYGLPLKPDWVIVLDAHNDAGMACAQGAGPGNPMGWPIMVHLLLGGDKVTHSAIVTWLTKHTAFGRVITGAPPAGQETKSGNFADRLDTVFFDPSEPEDYYKIKMRDLTMSVLDEQVNFYVFAEQNVKELFSSANVIFGTQPYFYNNAVSQWYRKAFDPQATATEIEAGKRSLKADLDAFMAKSAKTPCTTAVTPQGLGYFTARAALHLERAVAEWAAESKARRVIYTNTEMVLPADQDQRMTNFIDNAHLSDLGAQHIAEFFAGYVLQTDLSVPFDPAEYAKTAYAEAAKLDGTAREKYEYSPPANPPVASPGAKRFLEGVTATDRSPGAVQIDDGDAGGYHRVIWTELPAVAGKTNAATIDVWSDHPTKMRVEMLDTSNAYARADFDVTKQKTSGIVGKDAVAKIDDLGKGWKRLTLAMPLGGDKVTFNASLLSADGNVTYPGEKKSAVVTEPAITAQ